MNFHPKVIYFDLFQVKFIKENKKMNNSLSMSEECSISLTGNLIQNIMRLLVNIFGLIGNGLCVIVFTKIILKTQTQSNLFKFLLLKSIFDFCNFITNFGVFFYYCSSCTRKKSFGLEVWNIWFYNYTEYAAETASAIFEVAATFDCFITAKKLLFFCQRKLYFYLFSISVSISCVLLYLIIPFGYSIIKISSSNVSNQTFSYYTYKTNNFGSSKFSEYFYDADSSIRDGLFLLILLILNILILKLLKKSTQRRRNMVGNTTNNNSNNNLLSTAKNAEQKRMRMIAATGLNYMVGHLIFLVYNFTTTYYANSNTFCFHNFIFFFYDLCYADSIIFYYYFNNVFKKFLIQLVPFYHGNNQINTIN
jgi:hypothetical protein